MARTTRPRPTFGLPPVRNYECVKCQAKVGSPCELPDGQVIETHHTERWKVAFEDIAKNGKAKKDEQSHG